MNIASQRHSHFTTNRMNHLFQCPMRTTSHTLLALDTVGIILQFVDIPTLRKCSLVCVSWNKLASSESIWKTRCKIFITTSCFQITLQKQAMCSWKKFYSILLREEKKLAQHQIKQNRARVRSAFCRPSFTCGFRPIYKSSPSIPAPSIRPQTREIEISVPHLSNTIDEICILERRLGFDINESFVLAAMTRYMKFMKLKAKYPQFVLIPTIDIEMVWQSHLIRPLKYQKFCAKLLGAPGKYFMHELVLHDYVQFGHKENWLKKTIILWNEEYHEQYCPKFVKVIADRWLYHTEGVSREWVLTQPTEPLYDLNITTQDVLQDRNWFKMFLEYMFEHQQETTDKEQFQQQFSPDADKLIVVYKQYLQVMRKYSPKNEELGHPTFSIDLVWHAHMLHPHAYSKDCFKFFRYFVDHVPWPEKSDEEMKNAEEQLKEQWRNEYNNDVHQNYH